MCTAWYAHLNKPLKASQSKNKDNNITLDTKVPLHPGAKAQPALFII
jgi:hypothetical protein